MIIPFNQQQYDAVVAKSIAWQKRKPEWEETSGQHGIRDFDERLKPTIWGYLGECGFHQFCINTYGVEPKYEGYKQEPIDFIHNGWTIQVKGIVNDRGTFYFRLDEWNTKLNRKFPEEVDFGVLVIVNEKNMHLDVRKWLTREDFYAHKFIDYKEHEYFTDPVLSVGQWDMRDIETLVPILAREKNY